MPKSSQELRFFLKKKNLFFIGILLSILSASVLAIVIYSEWRLSRLVPGGWGEKFPTKVYGCPYVISHHSRHSPEQFIQRLLRLDYHSTANKRIDPGTYHWNGRTLTIGLRGFETPFLSQPPILVTLSQSNDSTWTLSDDQGHGLNQAALEPELAAELSGPKKIRREPAAWKDFPPQLVNAVIAVEDRRFYKHHGIDIRAILRAAWFNLRHRKNLQGGSTITQQLAKNFFLSQERTLKRKLLEVAFAIYLDFRTSKEQILTLYLNQIYMGQDGVTSVAGVRAAAQFYFAKELSQLDLSEAATLAGLIRSPYRYNPLQNPLTAQKRRNTVLKIMSEEGLINERDYSVAQALPVQTRKRTKQSRGIGADNDYFVAEVIRQLVPRFSEDTLFRYGLKIYTTLDPLLQKAAQSIVADSPHQAALITMDPQTGRVLALVGGKNFKESQFNRATQAHRQPGSVFKPFVYGTALEHGFTPASLLQDEPRAYTDGESIWAPQNFDGVYHGTVTLRQALSQSINGATLDLAGKLRPEPIIRFAQKMGIESPLERSLAIALGTSEVTPLELTAAYAPFTNGGFRVAPYLIVAVMDAENNIMELNGVERTSVLDPALSYLVTSLLETTVIEGTARSLRSLGWNAASAGKTGTTNDGRDAWFVGYTTDLLVGIWVGNDDAKPANLTGAKNALPLWAQFMKRVYAGVAPLPFEKPAGLVSVNIDPTSGMLARSGCPEKKEELFIFGTQPAATCSVHAGGFKGWLIKLFQKKRQPAPEKEAGRND